MCSVTPSLHLLHRSTSKTKLILQYDIIYNTLLGEGWLRYVLFCPLVAVSARVVAVCAGWLRYVAIAFGPPASP